MNTKFEHADNNAKLAVEKKMKNVKYENYLIQITPPESVGGKNKTRVVLGARLPKALNICNLSINVHFAGTHFHFENPISV